MHPPSSLEASEVEPPRRHALREHAIPQIHHGDGFACRFPSMRNVVDVTDNEPESVGSCRWSGTYMSVPDNGTSHTSMSSVKAITLMLGSSVAYPEIGLNLTLANDCIARVGSRGLLSAPGVSA